MLVGKKDTCTKDCTIMKSYLINKKTYYLVERKLDNHMNQLEYKYETLFWVLCDDVN